MSYEIEDPRMWRISKSGFSIKTGWDETNYIVAKYPGIAAPLDNEQFTQWLADAEHICELHNAMLKGGEQG